MKLVLELDDELAKQLKATRKVSERNHKMRFESLAAYVVWLLGWSLDFEASYTP